MKLQKERAHGVTPGLSRDYSDRNVEQQAAFVLPYLKSGMSLLDLGCGPGTITIGLAQIVSPGFVTGIDHDQTNIEAAGELAAKQGITNINFRIGNTLSLSIEDNSFDSALENNLFVHLAENAVHSAEEVYRVLKPGGFFAARDADADSVVWGNRPEQFNEFDKIFYKWQSGRGSDIRIGKKLPAILREAGFKNIIKSVSADTKGSPEAVNSHAEIMSSLLDGPLGNYIIKNKLGDNSFIDNLKESIAKWGKHTDSFFANVHVEVIGWKPE